MSGPSAPWAAARPPQNIQRWGGQISALLALEAGHRVGFASGVHRWTLRDLETEGAIRWTGQGYELTECGRQRIQRWRDSATAM